MLAVRNSASPTETEIVMSMITASAWVPRGAAAAFPTKYEVDQDELARISKLAKLRLEDVKEDLDDSNNGGKHDTEDDDMEVEGNGVKVRQTQE